MANPRCDTCASTRPASGSIRTRSQPAVVRREAMSLLPLRRPNDRFQLSLAGTEEVEGETCDGVKVTHKQMPDLTIFVSRKTGLIKKSTYMTRMAEKQFEKVKDETIYHSYKEFDGIKLPASMTVHRDGEKFVVSKTNKVTFPKSLDEDEFAKP